MTETRKLRIFLCHSSQNKSIVRELYQRLLSENWIDPWLDEEQLLPGQDWDMEIEKAVESADAVIVCLSNTSVTKEGYIQRELKFVLDIALEKPEGTIFVVPLRLDDCTLPRRLRSWQYVDYFPADQQKRAYQRLIQSLKVRHDQLTSKGDGGKKEESGAMKPLMKTSTVSSEEKLFSEIKMPVSLTASLPSTTNGILAVGGLVVQILFFALISLYSLGFNVNDMRLPVGISAILTGLFFLFNRQMIANKVVKFSTIFFIVTHLLLTYSQSIGLEISNTILIVDGIAAVLVGGSLVLNFQSPRKPAPYSSIIFAVLLVLIGTRFIINLFDYYPPEIDTPIIISAIVASILLWLEQ